MSNQDTTTSHALVALKPVCKPTKTQIIEAMVQVARRNHEQALEAHEAKAKSLRAILEKVTLAEFKKSKNLLAVEFCRYSQVPQVRGVVRTPRTLAAATALKDHWLEKPKFDEKEVRDTIRQKLGAPKPPLIESPEVVEGFTSVLKEWGIIS